MSFHKIYTSAELDELIEKQDVLMVFFGSKTCPGCNEMLPAYDHLARRYRKVMTFAYIDIDKAKMVFARLPLFVFFYHHQRQETLVGTGTDRLKEFVKSCLPH